MSRPAGHITPICQPLESNWADRTRGGFRTASVCFVMQSNPHSNSELINSQIFNIKPYKNSLTLVTPKNPVSFPFVTSEKSSPASEEIVLLFVNILCGCFCRMYKQSSAENVIWYRGKGNHFCISACCTSLWTTYIGMDSCDLCILWRNA
jgi:hypothetical protein